MDLSLRAAVHINVCSNENVISDNHLMRCMLSVLSGLFFSNERRRALWKSSCSVISLKFNQSELFCNRSMIVFHCYGCFPVCLKDNWVEWKICSRNTNVNLLGVFHFFHLNQRGLLFEILLHNKSEGDII